MAQLPQHLNSRPGADSRAAPRDVREAAGIVSFEPEAAVRAIVFHMVDEGLAREVKSESIGRIITQLRRRGLRPSTPRSTWEAMSNHDRLEWLLSETRVVPLMNPDDEVITLEPRDGR